MKSQFLQALLIPALIAMAAAGCNGDRTEATSDGAGAAGDTASGSQGAVRDPGQSGRLIPLDPATGSLLLKSAGAYPGEWTFDDVTATIVEDVVGGTTRTMLTIESHKMPPGEHFKLYASRSDGGPIEPGTYSISEGDRILDARWEHGDKMFKAMPPSAKGTLDVTKLTEDRVAGTFNIEIPRLDGEGKPAMLTGEFEMRLAR